MSDLSDLAAVIYGEAANQDQKVMKMVGSTVINRLKSGKADEFGSTIPEIIQNGYYAAKNQNIPYKEALSQKFESPEGERKYKQAVSIASSLLRGTIEPDAGMFYFTPSEIKRLKKNPKAFNFKMVKSVGSSGEYEVFDY